MFHVHTLDLMVFAQRQIAGNCLRSSPDDFHLDSRKASPVNLEFLMQFVSKDEFRIDEVFY